MKEKKSQTHPYIRASLPGLQCKDFQTSRKKEMQVHFTISPMHLNSCFLNGYKATGPARAKRQILKGTRVEQKGTEQMARGLTLEADWGAPRAVTHETRMGPQQPQVPVQCTRVMGNAYGYGLHCIHKNTTAGQYNVTMQPE